MHVSLTVMKWRKSSSTVRSIVLNDPFESDWTSMDNGQTSNYIKLHHLSLCAKIAAVATRPSSSAFFGAFFFVAREDSRESVVKLASWTEAWNWSYKFLQCLKFKMIKMSSNDIIAVDWVDSFLIHDKFSDTEGIYFKTAYPACAGRMGSKRWLRSFRPTSRTVFSMWSICLIHHAHQHENHIGSY